MSVLFNEHEADQAVKRVLLKQRKGKHKMSKYFKDPSDGQIYRATEYEVVSSEELNEHIAKLTEELADAASLASDGLVSVSVSAVEEESAGDEPAPTPEEAPAEQPESTPAEPAQQQEQPAPEAPTEPAPQPEEPAAPEEPAVVPPAQPDPINLQ